eukprot:TRINITY_DN1727_c0_g2_i3.p1 TRINITY_DN1727_c0_g2~~TRINITY_DN1727_c0_g2_i3.p1  ORF type:complete len:406 (+),score=94.58 TRINITY_DN1727_c0_g2_i3:89-1306(+)
MAAPEPDYDVVVIGGGVVGCGVFRAAALCNRRALLCERLPRLAGLASRGNSGMLHTGFDATPGTAEARLVRRGHELFWEWAARRSAQGLGTPCKRTGALMLAWDQQELQRLQEVHQTAARNGVETEMVSCRWLYREEPNLRAGAAGALHIPGETTVDPHLVPALYAAEGAAAGGTVHMRCAVRGAERSGGLWQLLLSSAGEPARRVSCRQVVNCGGLRGEEVEAMRLGAPPQWKIRPRLGRYAVFDRAAGSLVRRMLLPLPTKVTKGVILFPTVYGDTVIGPTAEEPGEREAHGVVMEKLRSAAVARVPCLAHHSIAWDYAGSRPALADRRDYWLESAAEDSWLTVAGIRSTGLSAALALGEEAARRLGWGPEGEAPPVPLAAVRSADRMVHPISAKGWPAEARL